MNPADTEYEIRTCAVCGSKYRELKTAPDSHACDKCKAENWKPIIHKEPIVPVETQTKLFKTVKRRERR